MGPKELDGIDVLPKLGEVIRALHFARLHFEEHAAGKATDAERAACVLMQTVFGMSGIWLEVSAPDATDEQRRRLGNALHVYAQFIIHEGA